MTTPMVKLIWPTTSTSYLEKGSSLLAGPAVREVDTADWTTPAAVLEAHGLDATGVESVDLLRFTPTPVTRLLTPAPDSPTALAGHDNGFLRGSGTIIPVWDVAPSEIPRWARLERLRADGGTQPISTFAGPALGWRRKGSGYALPSSAIGIRAVWRDTEYHASWVDDVSIEIVAIADEAPEGFTEARPHVFRRIVPAWDCSRVFELSLTATWNGPYGPVACTVIGSSPTEAAVLLHVDAERAAAIGVVGLEAGVFWRLVPQGELTDVSGTTTEWEIPAEIPWRSMPAADVADLLGFWAQAPWPLSRPQVHALAVERFGWTTEVEGGKEYLMNTTSGFSKSDVSTIGARSDLSYLSLDLSDILREITPESRAILESAYDEMVDEGERRWGPPTTRTHEGTTSATWTSTSGVRFSLNRNDRALHAFIQTPQGVDLDKRLGHE